MYSIITEKGLRENGQMEYEVFGITLRCQNNIEEVLNNLGRINLIKATSRPVLGNVIKENNNPEIFTIRRASRVISLEEWLNSEEQDLLKFYNIIFNAILYTEKSYYPEVYDEMLTVAKSFFIIGDKKPATAICVSNALALYIDVFQKIGFTLQQGTKRKIVTAKPLVACEWQGAHISVLAANTAALTLLANQTTYFDENGEEKPIILGGIKKTPTTWEVIPYERVEGGQVPNPLTCKKGYLLKPGK